MAKCCSRRAQFNVLLCRDRPNSHIPPQTPPLSTRAADLVITPRAGAGYSTSGSGYDGFGSFEGFIPLKQTPGQNLLYLVGRFLLDNEANPGGNLLVGYRFYSPRANLIYGTYLGYDSRSTGNSTFSQLGLGFEAMGSGWDARINGYIPVGDTHQTISEQRFDTGLQLSNFRFEDHYLRASGTQQQQIVRNVELAMAGFDVEAGGRLLKFGNYGDLRGYAGLYYLSGGGDNSAGIRGRLEARPLDYLTLGVAVQHDSIFGTNVVGTIALSFPSSRPRAADPDTVLARMGEMPYRVNAIAINNRTEVERISRVITDAILTNPSTGQPYFFQHVVLGMSGGNGTFESPFGVVQSALNATRSDGNDIVYVQAGTNPGIPAFTIPDRVQVLSTGPIQTLPATINGQFFPAYQLPLSGSGAYPNVNGTVTMRSDTVLSGFTITSATGPGVTFSNVNRVEVRDNFIQNTASAGILGNGVASANLFRNQITAAQDQGIYIQTVGIANVTDNSVTNTRAGSGTLANPITGNLTLGAITIPNPGSIIPLPTGQGIVIATATNSVNLARNSITGTGTQGIVVLNATGNTAITDNTVSGTVGALFPVTVPTIGTFNVPTGQGIVVSGVNGNLDVSRNSLTTLNGQGIAIAGTTNGTTTVGNNTIRTVADQGLLLAGTSGTTNISNNQISDISSRLTAVTLPLPLGTITFSTGQGLLMINSVGTVNVTGNTIERSSGVFTPTPTYTGGQGIEVANFSGQLNLNITNNQIRNNDNDGMIITLAGSNASATPPATGNITIANNTIENNGGATPIRGDGIAIAVEQDASLPNLLIENNTIRGNGDEGIDLRLATTSTLITPASASVNGIIRNNAITVPALSTTSGQNGIQVQTQSNAFAKVLIESNTISAANVNYRAIELLTLNSLLLGGTPRLSADVRLNQITGNTTPAFLAQTANTFPQVLCVNLSGNTSSTGYSFTSGTGAAATIQEVTGNTNTGTINRNVPTVPVAVCP